MERIPNGDSLNGTNGIGSMVNGLTDGAKPVYTNGIREPTLEELERELPVVHNGQVPLGELVSRMAQTIYAELTELAET